MNKEVLIKRFQIKELFGIYNVDIPFENYINIFVGENGLGKTTILNCLNYVLQRDVDNLYNIDFKEIVITFRSGNKVSIKHNNLVPNSKYNRGRIRRSNLDIEEYESITYNFLLDNYYKIQVINPSLTKEQIKEELIKSISHFPIYISSREIDKIIEEIEKNKHKDWRFQIQNEITNNILYLPTYRRIEEDFNKYINNDVKRDEEISRKFSSLQFGMDDVVKLIEKTCEQLRNTTNEGFKEMTGSLLKNYISIIDDEELIENYKSVNI